MSTNTALEPLRFTTSRAGRRLPLEFMDGLSYTTSIELAEPLARLSRRSQAKTDRRGSALDR